MAEPIIELENIQFYYEEQKQVLQNITLSLYASEVIILKGANGSGKSSFLQLLVGLLSPSKGLVKIFGKERQTEKDFIEVRKKIGFVFQDSDDQLFCPTVLEDVAFGPLNFGASKEQAVFIAKEALELVGLEGFDDRVTYKLSGGEKRLVAIATVLAMKPEVLLIDEPTNDLDSKNKERVLNLLEGLPQAKIIVSHDKELAERFPKNHYRLTNGTIGPVKNEM